MADDLVEYLEGAKEKFVGAMSWMERLGQRADKKAKNIKQRVLKHRAKESPEAKKPSRVATKKSKFDEKAFQSWYKPRANKLGIHPDPDHPKHKYDYRGAYSAGADADDKGHWPSKFKRPGHPRMVVDGVNTKTGLKKRMDRIGKRF